MNDLLFKKILPSILYTKQNVLKEDPEALKNYKAFIINRALSYHLDCIPYTNEMNRFGNMDENMQYDYYLNAIKKRSRKYFPWIKKKQNENLEIVKKYFNLSYKKALMALDILTEEQINEIREKTALGGITHS